ncbi:MAG: GHMP kinase [Gammaproteobacteria bacterium]|nr:GHMP kinase [Gammaproteobacteria bacterium]
MTSPAKITVTAPARLHMGFIGLCGALDRQFGSIGIAINEIFTRLTVSEASQRTIKGPAAARADKCLSQLCQALGVQDRLEIAIESAIPEHVGLGSGTQMALAIGTGLNAFYGLGLTVREIAAVMDRGLRSGIGIGVFEYSGLVVDGGRGKQTVVPPVLVNLTVPESWRFILVFDKRGKGLYGDDEINAFAALPGFPQREAEHLCYRLMMHGLPAVAEHDINAFGEVITQLQQAVGQHFAPVQGGIYASLEVAEAMAWLSAQGAVGVGQTSWGPTGFCMLDSIAYAQDLVTKARKQFAASPHLDFVMVSANNQKSCSRLSMDS